MESGYEFDSLSELPPLPQEFDPMEYSPSYHYAIAPLDSLPPFSSSDFTHSAGFTFSDHHHDLLHLQQHGADSFSLDTSLSLLTGYNLPESTRLEELDVLPFLHLPNLQSFEQTTAAENTEQPFLSLAPPPPPPPPVAARHDEEKRRRRRVGSLVKSTFTISSSSRPSSSSNSRSPKAIRSTYGGDRRVKISDKIRSLEKLMPWEKKMCLATILEEAHKYITFLQSQIASLRWMPLESVYCTTNAAAAGEAGRETDLLKSLTRQQLLQVLANSPGARTVMTTRGVCVFSYEQLLSVKMMAQSARNL